MSIYDPRMDDLQEQEPNDKELSRPISSEAYVAKAGSAILETLVLEALACFQDFIDDGTPGREWEIMANAALAHLRGSSPGFSEWTPQDAAAAIAEGWRLSLRDDGHWQIQKEDQPPEDREGFATDDDACGHVCWRATEGSALHRSALAVLAHRPIPVLPPVGHVNIHVIDGIVECITKPKGISVCIREYDSEGLEHPDGRSIHGTLYFTKDYRADEELSEAYTPDDPGFVPPTDPEDGESDNSVESGPQ